MKSRLIPLLIYVIVVGATLLATLEVGLRLYVKQPVLAFGDFRGANLMALEAGAKYDETLGWVQPAHITADGFNTMEYGIRKNSSRDGSISQGAILAVGDSYTAGSEVRDEESWPAQLEGLARIPVINAGVGGYGLDQIVLSAERLLPIVRPRMVIVGVYQEAIVRAKYSSYGVPKPYFVVEDGEWRLKNQPVPQISLSSPREEPLYRIALAHLLSVHIFMQRFFFDWWFSNGRTLYETASDTPGKTSCYLLERLQQRLAVDRIPAMIVVQYPGYSYIRMRPRADHVEDVLRCARDLGYEVVDEREHLSKLAQQSIARLREYYVMSPTGSYGHMSAQGNALIASLIGNRLPQLDRARIVPSQ